MTSTETTLSLAGRRAVVTGSTSGIGATTARLLAARGAHVIAVAAEGDTDIEQHADEVIYVPKVDWMLQPLLAVIPLQLLAHAIATKRGLNVDQPRNLAKTVTVE